MGHRPRNRETARQGCGPRRPWAQGGLNTRQKALRGHGTGAGLHGVSPGRLRSSHGLVGFWEQGGQRGLRWTQGRSGASGGRHRQGGSSSGRSTRVPSGRLDRCAARVLRLALRAGLTGDVCPMLWRACPGRCRPSERQWGEPLKVTPNSARPGGARASQQGSGRSREHFPPGQLQPSGWHWATRSRALGPRVPSRVQLPQPRPPDPHDRRAWAGGHGETGSCPWAPGMRSSVAAAAYPSPPGGRGSAAGGHQPRAGD